MDLHKLTAAAVSASAGTWTAWGPNNGDDAPHYFQEVLANPGDPDSLESVEVVCCLEWHQAGDAQATANLAYIAQAQPAVVLELIRRHGLMREALELISATDTGNASPAGALANLRKLAEETLADCDRETVKA